MKYIIGLTGPTGSGKSSFSDVAREYGIFVIDCDRVSRMVTQKGSECLAALGEEFGSDIVKDGKLDRKLLAQRAFCNAEKKSKLEEIIFPFILDDVLHKIEGASEDIILLDAPTLYESGIDELCSTVVAVLSDIKTRKKRIIERDNLTEEQAMIRINAGKPDEFYIDRADYIIYNSSDMEEFLRLCRETITILTEEETNE